MARPVVQILYPKGSITTVTPVIEWSYNSPDDALQESYRIYIEEYRTGTNQSNLFNLDTGLIQENQTFHLIDQPLLAGKTYKIILAVKDSNGEPSFQVEETFTVVEDVTSNPAVKITKPENLLTDSLTPIIEWDFVDPEHSLQSGYRIQYKDDISVLYDSNIVGSKDNYFKTPSGVFTTSQLVNNQKTITIILTVYSESDKIVGATDREELTIKMLAPEVQKFLINGEKTTTNPESLEPIIPTTFTKRIKISFLVLNAVEMIVSENESDLDDNTKWIDYVNEYNYDIVSSAVGTPIIIWAKFRSVNFINSSHVYERVIFIDPAQLTPVIVNRIPKVSETGFPIVTPIRVEFNKLMNRATVEKAFQLVNQITLIKSDGAFSWESANSKDTLIFKPVTLQFATRYGITIGPYNEYANETIQTRYPMDIYGLILTTASWRFTTEDARDIVPPYNPSIIIDAGESFTTDQNVTLALAADGDPSEMYIYGDIVGNAIGWIPYYDTYDVELTEANGTKIVNVMFRDIFENQSPVASDSIIYKDVIPPEPPASIYIEEKLGGHDVVYYPYVTVVVNTNPYTRILLFKDYYVQSHIGDDYTDATGIVKFLEIPLSLGLNSFYARSEDVNGNWSSKSDTVTITYNVPDREPPGIYKIIPIDNTHIKVYFTEPINMDDAKSIINYTSDNLVIRSVEVLGEEKESSVSYWVVELETSSQENMVYTLKVANVRDLYGNKIDYTRSFESFIGIPVIDTRLPIVVSASATTNISVLVNFSEALDQSNDLIVSNYSINGLQVVGVERTENITTYKLSTAEQMDISYVLTVTNVKDLAGNPIDALNNTTTFSGIPSAGYGGFRPIRAYSLSSTKVRIEFSQNLNFETALVKENYSIIGLDVLGVDKVDENTVELTTSHQSTLIYVVTLTGIKSSAIV